MRTFPIIAGLAVAVISSSSAQDYDADYQDYAEDNLYQHYAMKHEAQEAVFPTKTSVTEKISFLLVDEDDERLLVTRQVRDGNTPLMELHNSLQSAKHNGTKIVLMKRALGFEVVRGEIKTGTVQAPPEASGPQT